MVYASRVDSDQPGYSPSLIREFAVRLKVSYKDLNYLHAKSEDSEQVDTLSYQTIRCAFKG